MADASISTAARLRNAIAAICFCVSSGTFCSEATAALDTLVVCPAEFQPALDEWQAFRHEQGHDIQVLRPLATPDQLQKAIRRAAASRDLKFLVLIGEAPVRARVLTVTRNNIPTNYTAAKVNVRWGSDPYIATDIPYADLDSDGVPDLAIGRIPVTSPEQLQRILHKTILYERASQQSEWQRRLSFTTGQDGFGAFTDALIEAAARQIVQQNIPAGFITQHIFPGAVDGARPQPGGFPHRAQQQLSEGSLAWIYLGHGRETELDHVRTETGTQSILSIGDVQNLRCGGHSPLAVLVACSTGAIDSPGGCLASELLKADEGPVAVIAATRITMPYGNTVLGCELLRACFRDRPDHLGETLRIAERKTLDAPADDSLRSSLDSLAAGLSPPPVDLASERREHVLMYHLFGDPLLHLRYPIEAATDSATAADTPTSAK
jgi:hypothetical protein